MTAKTLLAACAITLSLAAPVLPARAQTAAQINQLNQAMQICNSPMGAAVPECATLRGQLGGANALGALGNLGGNGGQAAGIAGALLGAFGGANTQQAPAAPNYGALQANYAACIQRAGVNTAALQACAAQLQAATAGSGMAGVDRNTASAMATYGAAGNYQACVMANPTNWQACLNQMGAASNAGLAAAGVTAQQMQAAGLPSAGFAGAPTPAPAAPPKPPADPFAGVFGGQ